MRKDILREPEIGKRELRLILARPKNRGECSEGPRPCPFAGCRYHLYLDVNEETGSIKINFPDLEVSDLSSSCALDVADRGGVKLDDISETMNLSRERVRQIETSGLKSIEEDTAIETLAEFLGTWP